MLIDRNQRQPNSPPTAPPPKYVPDESQATKVGGPMKQPFGSGGMGGPGNMGGPGGHGGPGAPSVKSVDPGAIFPCLYRYTYIWPNRGKGFWAYPTYVGRNSISGWRYDGRRWVYFGMDLRRVRSFYCY